MPTMDDVLLLEEMVTEHTILSIELLSQEVSVLNLIILDKYLLEETLFSGINIFHKISLTIK